MPSSRKKGSARRSVNNSTLVDVLIRELVNLNLCSSQEEYSSVAEAIVSSYMSSSPSDECPPSKEDLEELGSTLVDYFQGDAEERDAKRMIHNVVNDIWGDEVAESLGLICSSTAADDEDDKIEGDEDEIEADDGDYVGEGECQLCERAVKLTRHHLIPKTTWPRIKKRLWNAASTIETYHSLDDDSPHEKKESLKNKLEKMLGMTEISDIPTNITQIQCAHIFSRCACSVGNVIVQCIEYTQKWSWRLSTILLTSCLEMKRY